ncbi:hypothetical protein [Mycobacterium tuberculosis]|uniref:hypothetical protein n=1 Tax=Mycobacterium tuberculosis TaxID=1773 RepID=UPI0027298242|nr:hypothetical protein [Mycobacterium tuberculosis]
MAIRARSLSVSASSTDDLLAESVAAGGGLVAATGAQSTTRTNQATFATIGERADIQATSVTVSSAHSQDIDGSAEISSRVSDLMPRILRSTTDKNRAVIGSE